MNNKNPNKRHGNFSSQQPRKRQKLNPNISSRGRGRGTYQIIRGRGIPCSIRGRGSRGSLRGRGSIRGSGSIRSRGRGTMNTNQPPNLIFKKPPSTAAHDEKLKKLRNQLLSQQKSPQKPTNNAMISRAMTSTQIAQEIKNQELADLKQQAWKTMPVNKSKRCIACPNPSQTQSQSQSQSQPITSAAVANQKRKQLLLRNKNKKAYSFIPKPKAKATKVTNMNINNQPTSTQRKIHRQLTPYRTVPISKNNLSFTTTNLDFNKKPTGITLSTNDLCPPNQNIPPPIQHTSTSISTPFAPVKPVIVKKKVINKVCNVANDAPNWRCEICTFDNKDNTTLVCQMCAKTNKSKTPIPTRIIKPMTKIKIKTKTKAKVLPVHVPGQSIPKPRARSVPQKPNNDTVLVNKNAGSMDAPPERVVIKPPKRAVIKPKVVSIAKPKPSTQNTIHKIIAPKPPVFKQNIAQNAKPNQPKIQAMKKSIFKKATQPVQKVITKPIQKPIQKAVQLPPLQHYWKLDIKHNKISGKSLELFVKETDAFIKSMDTDLKSECAAAGIEYFDPYNFEKNDIMFEITEDFEWTKKICRQHNIAWPNNFDMNAFSNSVTQCNDW